MFKEKFIEEMQNIMPSEAAKTAILNQIKTQQEHLTALPPKKSAKKRWISALAAAIVLIIVSVSVFNLPYFNGNNYISDTSSLDDEDIFTETYSSSDESSVSEEMMEETVEEEDSAAEEISSTENNSSKKEASSKNNTPSDKKTSSKKSSSSKKTSSKLTSKGQNPSTSKQSQVTTSGAVTSKEDKEESADDSVIKPMKGAPANITYTEAYELFEKIDTLQTKQKDHNKGTSSKKGTTSSSLGSSNNSSSSKNYTNTNVQVEGVDEGDVVKTDGEYIYILRKNSEEISIAKVDSGKIKAVASIDIKKTPNYELYEEDLNIDEIYLYENTLVAIIKADRYSKKYQGVCIITMLFDVSNPKSPKHIKEFVQTGSSISSRLIGNRLYVFSEDSVYRWETTKLPDGSSESKKVWQLPQNGENNKILKPIAEKDLYVFDDEVNLTYFLAVSIDLKSRERIDSKSVIGGGENVYVSNNSIYVVSSEINYFQNEKEYKPKTYIIKFGITSGKIIPLAKTSVKGSAPNQFLMDESDGYFRIITTTRRYKQICGCGFRSTVGVESNDIYVFDKNLKVVGSVNGIAKDEAVTSSRFMGDIGYFCTSPLNANTDPFFAVDFSNPANPKVLASLEFPGVADYLHPFGENMMLGIGMTENGRKYKLIMFDISDPKNIKELFSYDTNIEYSSYRLNVSDVHKQINILKEKNIICFPNGGTYHIFTFSKQTGFAPFKENTFLAQTNKSGYINDFYSYLIRGIFIDDYLYVCNYNGIISYLPFKDGQKIAEIKFK